MKLNITLNPSEIGECRKNPVILRALADYNDCEATAADAVGGYENAVKFHESRAEELRAEADRIESEY